MTRLEVKDLDSSDVDIGEWRPDGAENVYIQLSITIGEQGIVGGDIFQTIVATPEGLRQASTLFGQVISTRGLIVVSEFSWQQVRSVLDDIVASCADADWPRSVQKLERYFVWEYDDSK